MSRFAGEPLRVRVYAEDVLIVRGAAQSWEPGAVRVAVREIDALIADLVRLRDAGVHEPTGHVAGCSCMDCVVYMR